MLAEKTDPVTARQLQAAFQQCTHVYDYLHELTNTLDVNHPEGRDALNTRELFPIADHFVGTVVQLIDKIIGQYVEYLEQGEKTNSYYAKMIESEGILIFNEVKKVAVEAQKLKVHPLGNRVQQLDSVPYLPAEAARQNDFATPRKDPRAFYQQLRTKRGPIQTMLFEEARRLGPEFGSNFLLGVEDVFLASIDMLRQLRKAGLNIDMDVFPGREARPEHWGFEAHENYSAFDSSVRSRAEELKPVEPVFKSIIKAKAPKDKYSGVTGGD